jgi:hypothetical protein
VTASSGGRPSTGGAGSTEGAPSPAPGSGRAAPDPLGKRALYWAPGEAGEPGEQVAEPALRARPAVPATGAGRPLGKRALYSAARSAPGEVRGYVADPVIGGGPVTVCCSSCGVTSRIGLLDFALFQLPLGFWLPRGRYGHRMTCPACRRRAWVGVTLRRD